MARDATRAARQTPARSAHENRTTLYRLCQHRYVRGQTAPAHLADHHATNSESTSRDSRTQYWLGGGGCGWKSRFVDWRAGASWTRTRHSVVQLASSFVPKLLPPGLYTLLVESAICHCTTTASSVHLARCLSVAAQRGVVDRPASSTDSGRPASAERAMAMWRVPEIKRGWFPG
jgi:hypothetical protein